MAIVTSKSYITPAKAAKRRAAGGVVKVPVKQIGAGTFVAKRTSTGARAVTFKPAVSGGGRGVAPTTSQTQAALKALEQKEQAQAQAEAEAAISRGLKPGVSEVTLTSEIVSGAVGKTVVEWGQKGISVSKSRGGGVSYIQPTTTAQQQQARIASQARVYAHEQEQKRSVIPTKLTHKRLQTDISIYKPAPSLTEKITPWAGYLEYKIPKDPFVSRAIKGYSVVSGAIEKAAMRPEVGTAIKYMPAGLALGAVTQPGIVSLTKAGRKARQRELGGFAKGVILDAPLIVPIMAGAGLHALAKPGDIPMMAAGMIAFPVLEPGRFAGMMTGGAIIGAASQRLPSAKQLFQKDLYSKILKKEFPGVKVKSVGKQQERVIFKKKTKTGEISLREAEGKVYDVRGKQTAEYKAELKTITIKDRGIGKAKIKGITSEGTPYKQEALITYKPGKRTSGAPFKTGKTFIDIKQRLGQIFGKEKQIYDIKTVKGTEVILKTKTTIGGKTKIDTQSAFIEKAIKDMKIKDPFAAIEKFTLDPKLKGVIGGKRTGAFVGTIETVKQPSLKSIQLIEPLKRAFKPTSKVIKQPTVKMPLDTPSYPQTAAGWGKAAVQVQKQIQTQSMSFGALTPTSAPRIVSTSSLIKPFSVMSSIPGAAVSSTKRARFITQGITYQARGRSTPIAAPSFSMPSFGGMQQMQIQEPQFQSVQPSIAKSILISKRLPIQRIKTRSVQRIAPIQIQKIATRTISKTGSSTARIITPTQRIVTPTQRLITPSKRLITPKTITTQRITQKQQRLIQRSFMFPSTTYTTPTFVLPTVTLPTGGHGGSWGYGRKRKGKTVYSIRTPLIQLPEIKTKKRKGKKKIFGWGLK